jgi:magnesium transporter
MLKAYRLNDGALKGSTVAPGQTISDDVLWLDMLDPTDGERHAVDRCLGMALPTRADMEEIEASSRLFLRDGGAFMTVLAVANSESQNPVADAITFVLAHQKLVTIRFIDPQSFRTLAARCERETVTATCAEDVLMTLLDLIVDRMADALERIGAAVDEISREIFNPELSSGQSTTNFQDVLRRCGQKNDLTGKVRESLLTIARMLSFLSHETEGKSLKDVRSRIKTLTRDIQSLQDHSSHVTTRLGYLLEATLGLINIDQNNIIKIMSVSALMFLPPTLIASLVNFKFMPQLDWTFGYPLTLALMVGSAVMSYFYFRRRGWL